MVEQDVSVNILVHNVPYKAQLTRNCEFIDSPLSMVSICSTLARVLYCKEGSLDSIVKCLLRKT